MSNAINDETRALLNQLAEELHNSNPDWSTRPNVYPAGKAILKLPPDQLVEVALEGEAIMFPTKRSCDRYAWEVGEKLVDQILRRKIPFNDDQLARVARRLFNSTWQVPKSVVSVLERHAAEEPLPEEAVKTIRAFMRSPTSFGADGERAKARLGTLLGEAAVIELARGEAWSDAAMADLEAMPKERAQAWTALLLHCRESSGAKPSGKWNKQAEERLHAVGSDEVKGRVLRWFPLVDKPRTQQVQRQHQWEPDANLMINTGNADVLKGLVWCIALMPDPALTRAVAALTLSAYKKVPGVGPRAVSLGNACLYTLGSIPGLDAVGQLAFLKVKVKFGTAQKLIDKAFNAAAEREGLPREEIEEMAVPEYGMTGVGIREDRFGEFKAQLIVTGTTSTELKWIKPDGKPQKSVPKAVKDEHAEDLKELKAAAKDVQKMLPAQRDRIDQLFLQQKTWPHATWAERYLNHPVVGVIARRLIWTFAHGDDEAIAGVWLDDKLVDADAKPITVDADTATVALWHPIGQAQEDVLAWRAFFESREIQQPFKQAHREVYLLTDAERNTGSYSNRFAAHVIRQHQFNALCAVRGWKNKLRLMVDDEYPPASRDLSAFGLRAEFWVEGVGEEYGVDTNETGTYYYLATDQVRFYRMDAAVNYAHAGGGGYTANAPGPGDGNHNEPLPLEDIPPLVFSEVLRDVDLFVGVGSVGNDPTWQDGGPEGRYRDYWQSYAFGDLSGTANTRKALLQRLVPRLKIADRCSFDDKFLVVLGDIRTYKIHLGSGNILMKPNDQYLCIVPNASMNKGAAGKVFLPFEGDRTLSIILSKAFLLAEDTKIKDTTILSQLRQ